MASQIIGVSMFAQPSDQAQIQENIKDSNYWPFVREATSDRWIPLTKGQ